ncbi:divalent cation tolerance protein [Bordetella pertussis]|nr:divalent cation tolerance protein [Bordetella pertussis]
MLRDDDVVLVISNAPDMLLAKRMAHVLVEDGLAACEQRRRLAIERKE